MENKATTKLLIILIMATVVTGQGYFSGLNIDPVLLQDTNAAIKGLK